MNMFDKINDKLREIEERENVKILLAIESGSRAWGFASPDSDYDVRFIYMRPKAEYLRLDEPKDVIEWAHSPIVYMCSEEWDTISEVAESYFSAKAAIYHYYSTAKNTFINYLQDENVKYKKYFYALRPLLACRYIEEYNCPPPVLFDDLLKLDLPDKLRTAIDDLLEIKKVTDEKTLNPQMLVIYDFIKNELEVQKMIADSMVDDHVKDWSRLNEVFRKVLG